VIDKLVLYRSSKEGFSIMTSIAQVLRALNWKRARNAEVAEAAPDGNVDVTTPAAVYREVRFEWATPIWFDEAAGTEAEDSEVTRAESEYWKAVRGK